ncbi:cadherin-like and PC-esterase domain-containing protein 1 isoform X2 [Oculina patagonica]
MRLLRLCRRRYVVVLLALITTMTVLLTYWIESRLQRDSEIPHESFQSVERATSQQTPEFLRLKGADIEENELASKREESREARSPRPKLAYSVTGKAKVAEKITEMGFLQRLKELEEKKLKRQSEVLLVYFLDSMRKNFLEIFKHTFEALGYKAVLLKHTGISTSIKKEWQGHRWCFNGGMEGNATAEMPCFQRNDPFLLQENQKVSPVPGIGKLLLRNDGFCYLMSASKHISAFKSKPLSPDCFVLPAQFKLFLQDIKERRSQAFTLKSLGSVTTTLSNWGDTARSTSEKIDQSSEAVVQSFPADVLLIEDKAVIVQIYALVTSVSPLRVYRHNEGHVLLRGTEQVSSGNWDLEQFYKHLENNFGEDKISKAIEWMDELVVKMLLLLEPSLVTYFSGLTAGGGKQILSCRQCFQALEISFTFSSSLHPFILEVKAPAFEKASQGVIQDTVNVLFNMSSVLLSQDIHHTLEVMKETLMMKNSQCQGVKGKCLTDNFLEYLLDAKQEEQHVGNFKKLYPTPDGDTYKELMSELLDTGVDLNFKQRTNLGTPDVHDILTLFEARPSTATSNSRISEDPEADPVLLELNTRPTVLLRPQFTSNIFIYQTTVSFDTMVLQVWGKASTCQSDVRINTKYDKDSQTSNHSLGVGWNKFSILVVDTSLATPEVVDTYHLFVFRKRRSETEGTFDKESMHQVCAHHQECSLKVFPSTPCGLDKLSDTSWKSFLIKQEELPHCETGHESGRWVLPCTSCDDSNSCYWREAVWAPFSCQYNVLSRDDTRTCLANKKILFVGDSTNRGIMYYLMEKLNGSLRKWEKTHTMKIYSDELNGRRTSVSFAYYPQFWLSENKRPVFVKALYQLIARFLPLENNTNTILVVGGVQWMGSRHITETNKALTSLGLNGIKVIIKSLGSGFHLPVPGLPRHDLAGQRKIAERNQRVISAAKRLGYEVVDTFGMTVSRYKDFLLGNCGCHFHKVVDMRSLMKEEDEVPSPLLDNNEKQSDVLPRYHVMGPINSVYSELVINRMCS